jgi:hypothetical protein
MDPVLSIETTFQRLQELRQVMRELRQATNRKTVDDVIAQAGAIKPEESSWFN